MDDDDLYQRRRETLLVVFLGGATVIGLLVFFTILTGGFLLYILLVMAVAGMVGGLHYLLWGRAYTEETAGQREEMEAQEQLDETRRPRHY